MKKNLFQSDGVSIEGSSFIHNYIAVKLFIVYSSPINYVCKTCMMWDEYIVFYRIIVEEREKREEGEGKEKENKTSRSNATSVIIKIIKKLLFIPLSLYSSISDLYFTYREILHLTLVIIASRSNIIFANCII